MTDAAETAGDHERAAGDESALWRAVLAQSVWGVARIDAASDRILETNERFAALMGYGRDELAELEGRALTCPEDRPEEDTLWRRLSAGEIREFTLDKRCRRKDGAVIWTRWTVSPSAGGGGSTGSLVALVQDIGEGKRTEAALRASETLLRTAVDSMPFEFWTRDREHRCTMQNAPSRAHWGDLVGTRPEEAGVPAEELSTWQENNRRVLEGQVVDDEVTYAVNGEERIYANILAPIRVEGEILGSLGFNIDITDRRRAERALQESEITLRAVFDSSIDAVGVSCKGAHVFVNQAYRKLFGCDPQEDLTRTSILELIAPSARKDIAEKISRRVRGDEVPGQYETRGLRRDGTEFEMDVHVSNYQLWGQTFTLVVLRDISEQKRVETSLRLSEARLREAVRCANIGIFDHDHVSGEVFWSPEQRRINGWTADPSPSLQDFVALLHPEDRERIVKALREAHDPAGDGRFDVDERIVRPSDGKVRWLTTRSKTFFEGAGSLRRPTRTIGAVVDVTEAKLAEQALREREDLLRRSQSVAHIGSYYFDVRAGTWVSSPALDELFGIDDRFSKSVDGWISLVHPEDQRAMIEHLQVHVLQQHHRFEREYRIVRRSDGQERWVFGLGELEFDGTDVPARMIGTIQDITERKQAELAQARLVQTMEATPDFVGFADARTTDILYINRAGRAMVGLTEDEDVSRLRISDVHPEWTNQMFRDVILPTARRQGEWTGECAFLHRDGHEIPVLMALVAHRSPGGEVERFSTISRDITGRKRDEEALRASLEEKRVLLKEVHHRVKNNLQVISSLLSLQSRQERAPEVVAALRDTQNRAHSMALLHEMLYRSESLARVNVGAYLQQVCAHLYRALGADPRRIRLDCRSTSVELGLDHAVPCGLIVNELVSNALKHAFPSGRSGCVTVELRPSDDRLTLAVADDGVGIPETVAFDRTPSLGLRMVHLLSQQMGGALTVHREAGTRVELSFEHRP